MINFLSHKRQITAGLLLAASVGILSACAETPVAETTTEEEAAENVTQEELSSGAEGLIGETVSVRGEVGETVDESSFLFENNEVFGNEGILVINASGEPLVLPDADDSQVQVTGEVQQLVIADVENEYGLDLDPDLYVDYEDRPVVIAQSAVLAPDPGELTSNPELYYNQVIAVTGEIEEEYSPTTFSIDEEELFGDEDLLVISQMASPQAQDGEEVTVTGVLRPYVASDFEREYDLDWDLSTQEQIEVEYSERPVLVADEVYPSAM